MTEQSNPQDMAQLLSPDAFNQHIETPQGRSMLAKIFQTQFGQSAPDPNAFAMPQQPQQQVPQMPPQMQQMPPPQVPQMPLGQAMMAGGQMPQVMQAQRVPQNMLGNMMQPPGGYRG